MTLESICLNECTRLDYYGRETDAFLFGLRSRIKTYKKELSGYLSNHPLYERAKSAISSLVSLAGKTHLYRRFIEKKKNICQRYLRNKSKLDFNRYKNSRGYSPNEDTNCIKADIERDYIKRYDSAAASESMKMEMAREYCLNKSKSLKEIAGEISKKYSMNVSASTIRRHARKYLGIRDLTRKNSEKAYLKFIYGS